MHSRGAKLTGMEAASKSNRSTEAVKCTILLVHQYNKKTTVLEANGKLCACLKKYKKWSLCCIWFLQNTTHWEEGIITLNKKTFKSGWNYYIPKQEGKKHEPQPSIRIGSKYVYSWIDVCFLLLGTCYWCFYWCFTYVHIPYIQNLISNLRSSG